MCVHIHIQCVYLSIEYIDMMDTTFLDLRINYMDIMGHTHIYIPGSTDNHIQPHRYIHYPRNLQLLNVVLGSAEHP